MVVNGVETSDVYEAGDKLWFVCDNDVDEELLPVCDSRLESIKFLVFLFLRWLDPLEVMR